MEGGAGTVYWTHLSTPSNSSQFTQALWCEISTSVERSVPLITSLPTPPPHCLEIPVLCCSPSSWRPPSDGDPLVSLRLRSLRYHLPEITRTVREKREVRGFFGKAQSSTHTSLNLFDDMRISFSLKTKVKYTHYKKSDIYVIFT